VSVPRDILESLPSDLSPNEIASWARISRSFDRIDGEALVVRHRDGRVSLLTRPEPLDLFRALPLAIRDPVRVVGAGSDIRLSVRVIDGRVLALPLAAHEVQPVLDALAQRAPSIPPPPRAAPLRAKSVAPSPSAASPTSPPSAERTRASVRPPESAEMEIVRVPRSVRRAPSNADAVRPGLRPSPRPPAGATSATSREGSGRPAAPGSARPAPPSGVTSTGKHESVRPPAFAVEPAPIVRSARDTDALRARFRHHWSQGQLDEASQVARALVHLGIADGLERRLATIQPEVPPSFGVPLTQYLFRAYLAHDEEEPEIGRLLAAIWPAFLPMRVRPDADMGLKPRDEVDANSSSSPFARLFAHGARAFGLPVPRLFLRTDVPGGMAHLHAMPIASLCGGTLATGFDNASTLHVLGHHLSLYRPEAYLLALAPQPHELLALVLAAMHLEGRIPSDDTRVTALAETLDRHMVPPVREALRNAAIEMSLPGPDPRAVIYDGLRHYRRAVYLTAVRAGFALSGSLAVSDRMQRVMPAVAGLAIDEMLDDLITYSVSPAWAALRKELGLAIEPSAPNHPIER
jgi:hypothetical protein